MAASRVGGWLQGKTIRKGGALSSNSHTRSSTPQVQSTSTTVFGGGVKDASGRTTEYFVSAALLYHGFAYTYPHSLWTTNVQSARATDISIRNYVSLLVLATTKCEVHSCFYWLVWLTISRCESCIDRLFTLGPAPCPICNKVLRKLAFMPQTFEDLTVEKEVAVRRRIAKEYTCFPFCLT